MTLCDGCGRADCLTCNPAVPAVVGGPVARSTYDVDIGWARKAAQRIVRGIDAKLLDIEAAECRATEIILSEFSKRRRGLPPLPEPPRCAGCGAFVRTVNPEPTGRLQNDGKAYCFPCYNGHVK